MATTNRTRQLSHHKKRGISYAFADLDLIAASALYQTTAEVYQLFSLPAGSLIVIMTMNLVVAVATATTATCDIGVAGANELHNDFDLKGSVAATTTLEGVYLPTGGVITFTPTYTGTAATAGRLQLLIGYVETDKTNGEMTVFV
jgi:hypothetical protein